VLSESIGPQQEAIAATSLILSFGREQEDRTIPRRRIAKISKHKTNKASFRFLFLNITDY